SRSSTPAAPRSQCRHSEVRQYDRLQHRCSMWASPTLYSRVSYQPQTFVNVLLIGRYLLRQHIVNREQLAACMARLHHGIGTRHRARALCQIDLDGTLALNAQPKVSILHRDQLAICLLKGKIILPQAVAAKEGRGRFVQAEIGREVE